MMMARRRKRSKSWISWLIILILLIAACVVVYLVWDNYFNDSKKAGYNDDEISDISSEENQKEEEKEPEIVEKEEIVQYEGENPNAAEVLSGAITYVGVTNGKLAIRVNIDQYLSGGTCVLRLNYEDDVVMYSDNASIINSASTSTCEGFDVPLDALPSGKYLIFIDLNADGKSGVISGEANI